MARYVVATAGELTPGKRKIVEIGGVSVGVFNVGGEYFALRNRCPHQGGPLCEGRLAGFVDASVPGEIRYSHPGEILRCPWHGWEYDIRTGQSYFRPGVVRARAYPVEVEPGGAPAAQAATPAPEVTTIEGAGVRTSGLSDLRKGPYVVETFPVSVDEQYVLVEL